MPRAMRRDCISSLLADQAAGAAQTWASELMPELEAMDTLSAIASVSCRRLAAVEAARAHRIALLPKEKRVRLRRGGTPAPSVDVVSEFSKGYGHSIWRLGRLSCCTRCHRRT